MQMTQVIVTTSLQTHRAVAIPDDMRAAILRDAPALAGEIQGGGSASCTCFFSQPPSSRFPLALAVRHACLAAAMNRSSAASGTSEGRSSLSSQPASTSQCRSICRARLSPMGPGTLDLAPHTGGNFDLLRKGLVQPLGWQARGNGALEKAAMQRKDIATARDGDIGHCSKTTTTRQEKIVPVVDVAVNTIYSQPHSRLKPSPFSNP
jgi:hypothetical protein